MPRLQELARKRLIQWMDSHPRITQTEIGRSIGHNQAWVSKYRLGTMDADIDDLDGMARVFGHSIIELLDLRPDPKERDLLDAYRAIPPESRPVALAAVQAMAGRLPPPPPRKRNGG